jgi:hypothetical protein
MKLAVVSSLPPHSVAIIEDHEGTVYIAINANIAAFALRDARGFAQSIIDIVDHIERQRSVGAMSNIEAAELQREVMANATYTEKDRRLDAIFTSPWVMDTDGSGMTEWAKCLADDLDEEDQQ